MVLRRVMLREGVVEGTTAAPCSRPVLRHLSARPLPLLPTPSQPDLLPVTPLRPAATRSHAGIGGALTSVCLTPPGPPGTRPRSYLPSLLSTRRQRRCGAVPWRRRRGARAGVPPPPHRLHPVGAPRRAALWPAGRAARGGWAEPVAAAGRHGSQPGRQSDRAGGQSVRRGGGEVAGGAAGRRGTAGWLRMCAACVWRRCCSAAFCGSLSTSSPLRTPASSSSCPRLRAGTAYAS